MKVTKSSLWIGFEAFFTNNTKFSTNGTIANQQLQFSDYF